MPESTLVKTGTNQYKHPASGCIIGWNGDAWEIWDQADVSLKAFGVLRDAERWCDAQQGRAGRVALSVAQARAVRLALARAEHCLLLGREPHEDAETRKAIERCQEARTVVEGALSPHGLVPAETLWCLDDDGPRCEHGTFVGGMEMCRQCLDDGLALAGQTRPARADTGPGEAPNAPRLTDETIEAGLDLSGVCPALVEWYGNPAHRVTIRVETHIGKYAEASLYPHFTAEDVADKLRGLSVAKTPKED